MRRIGGHLGGRVSALVDGQLDAERAGRAWTHVAGCRSCQEEVERETWVKNRLSLLAPTEPPTGLTQEIGRLPAYDGREMDSRLAAAWATVCELERRQRLKRTALVAAGAGSAAAAVISLGAVSGSVDIREPRPAGAVVGRSTPTPSAVPTRHPATRSAPSPTGSPFTPVRAAAP